MASNVDANELHGIQRLAAAVLLQAITDLQRGTAANRREAAEWFEKKSMGSFTFQSCCEILDRDPEDVRQRLLSDYGVPRTFLHWFEESESQSSYVA